MSGVRHWLALRNEKKNPNELIKSQHSDGILTNIKILFVNTMVIASVGIMLQIF